MSRRIARILNEPERQVTKLIAQLEDKNSYPSHDARFLAQTAQKTRLKLADLKLDPDDTTAEELYEALQVKFERDSRLFNEYFGADKMDLDQKTAKAISLLEPYSKEARQWGLKKSAAKEVMRSLPPKKLMKQLNYRSAGSMLKREDLAEVYLASAALESDNWLKAHKKLVSKLDQSAFEIRNVTLVELSSDRWQGFDGPEDHLVRSEEIAALGIWPSKSISNSSLLNLILMLADRLSLYTDINASRTTAHLNGIVVWWADMDHLVAELYGETVSLNLKDCSANHLSGNTYEERSLAHGRIAFWRELLNLYEKLPEIDGLFDNSAVQKITGINPSAPEPAYEFVEDF